MYVHTLFIHTQTKSLQPCMIMFPLISSDSVLLAQCQSTYISSDGKPMHAVFSLYTCHQVYHVSCTIIQFHMDYAGVCPYKLLPIKLQSLTHYLLLSSCSQKFSIFIIFFSLLGDEIEIEWFYSCYINAHCCGEFCIT